MATKGSKLPGVGGGKAIIGKAIAVKAGYAVACVLSAVMLVVSGYSHKITQQVGATGDGVAIQNSPSIGEMNILIMGLESRTNYEGQTLPESLLTAMHAGNATAVSTNQVGSQDTDTLILLHIFAGGQKAVGISVPRDDLVTYPHSVEVPTADGEDDVTQGKIDQAYAFAYDQSLGQTINSSDSQKERYLLANQAGQLFEIQTVEAVTGVQINHFVEVNLAGFYYLAQAFHGIEVCVTKAPAENGLGAGANLEDQASGWDAFLAGYNQAKGGSQYLHLSAAQSLAYVRDRDSLPEIDLDRTKRQQAVIDYAIWKAKNEGAFSDLSLLENLISTASQYLITDSTFSLVDFATNMRALTGSHLTFLTLPIASEVTGYELNGSAQDINTISLPYVQQYVKGYFTPPVASTPAAKSTKKATPTLPDSSVTVAVYNGGTTPGLAGDVSSALTSLGYKAGAVADATAQSQTVTTATQVFYGAGAAGNAAQIATDFSVTAKSIASLPADHVEVLLGTGSTSVPTALSSTANPSSTSAASSGNDGQTGGAVTVSSKAPYGVPCVY
jgi:LCP family protein required for cell wall assembly